MLSPAVQPYDLPSRASGPVPCSLGGARPAGPVAVSLVVPVLDEVENLPELHREVVAAMDPMGLGWELIYVDDGSTDGSREALSALHAADPRAKVIRFRRNYGQTAALAAGFAHAEGEVVVTLDADLQNDPADIPALLALLAEGYDVVCGWRRCRRDPFLTRRLPSRVANRLINKLIEGTGVQLHDFGCTLKAYRAEVVRRLTLYGEMHRFIPAFAAWLGVRVAEVEVHHRARRHGRPKYGLGRVLRVLPDLVTVRFFADYFTRPAHFFGKIAAASLAGGVALSALLLAVARPLGLSVDLNTFLMIHVLTGLVAVQFVCLGLLGEITIRGYQETSGRAPYVVQYVLDREVEARDRRQPGPGEGGSGGEGPPRAAGGGRGPQGGGAPLGRSRRQDAGGDDDDVRHRRLHR